jgi:murein L,D-transpeptidase YafK
MKIFILALVAIGIVSAFYLKKAWLLNTTEMAIEGPKTVDDRLVQYSSVVAARLKPDFDRAGIAYPPGKMTLVVLKQERIMEIYAQNLDSSDKTNSPRFIRSYPILAASGQLGPKLREGDGQVPEGIYAVESLNPNSHYHLALHVDYPNAFDRTEAKNDGRTALGGEIMIHGSDVSIGCVAMGDTTAEDLFVLAAKTGLPNVRLLFCPFDFRLHDQVTGMNQLPDWTPKLYSILKEALASLPLPPQ